MAEVSAELVYEVLKVLQRDVSQVKSETGEIKLQMQATQLAQNAARQEVLSVHTELVGIQANLARHGNQLDRIERRLELTDTPRLTV
jgi:hypothetical protein